MYVVACAGESDQFSSVVSVVSVHVDCHGAWWIADVRGWNHLVRLVRGQYVVVRGVNLQHSPHPLHIVLGVSPIPLAVQVSEEDSFL